MSDYQSCDLLEILGPRECLIEATLCHADALLPLPDDHPTLLRMLCEGRDRKKLPAFRPDLDTFSDAALIAQASEVIEGAEVVWCGAEESVFAGGPNGTMARYRVRFRDDLAWKGIAAGGGWSAAADVHAPRQEQLDVHKNSFLARFSKSPKRLPPAQSVARLGQILAGRPAQVGGFATLVSSYEGMAAPLAPLLAEALYDWPECIEVALALGRIGATASIGSLVLALWQGRSGRLRNENDSLERAALVALGWYGPQARPLAEPYLRRDLTPTPALSFARWRVLGDEAVRRAFVSSQWPRPESKDAPGWSADVVLAVFGGSVPRGLAVIDGVRAELGKKSLQGIPFATYETWHRAKLAKLDAMPRAPQKSAPARRAPKKAVTTKKAATTKKVATPKKKPGS